MRGEDTIDKMMRWEAGELNKQQTTALFQQLIDSGFVWQLQGVYGRTAQALIDAGLCKPRVED